MKVLHIINDLSSGGAQKLISDTLPLMKANGIDTELLLLDNSKNVFEENLIKNKIRIMVLKRKKIRSVANILSIRSIIKAGKYSIVHVHLFPSLYWASLAAKTIFNDKPKLIYTEHNTYNRRRKFIYLRILEKFIYSTYDKIISISEATQRSLVGWIKPSKQNYKKFVTICNGIDISRFYNAIPYKKSELIGISESEYLVCMVGRFSIQKDQETLIKAISLLPRNVHLLLVGEGPTKDKCSALANSLGISNRVHFLGFRDDVNRIYKTADINVLSSKWEGFGLVAVEALASGKPFICSNVPGLADVVCNLAEVFDVGNYKLLSEHISNHIKKIGLHRIEVSDYLNKYDIKSYVEQMISLYKNA